MVVNNHIMFGIPAPTLRFKKGDFDVYFEGIDPYHIKPHQHQYLVELSNDKEMLIDMAGSFVGTVGCWLPDSIKVGAYINGMQNDTSWHWFVVDMTGPVEKVMGMASIAKIKSSKLRHLPETYQDANIYNLHLMLSSEYKHQGFFTSLQDVFIPTVEEQIQELYDLGVSHGNRIVDAWYICTLKNHPIVNKLALRLGFTEFKTYTEWVVLGIIPLGRNTYRQYLKDYSLDDENIDLL